jgi:hypothetical protein
MYETENLTVNSGTLAAGGVVTFDLPIKSRWCKIVSVKIVQIIAGAMEIRFEVYESTAAQAVGPANRALLYQQTLGRTITQTIAQGGVYGESLAGNPMPYHDRDARDEESTYMLHCRLENALAGTASDFAVSVTVADIGENA